MTFRGFKIFGGIVNFFVEKNRDASTLSGSAKPFKLVRHYLVFLLGENRRRPSIIKRTYNKYYYQIKSILLLYSSGEHTARN